MNITIKDISWIDRQEYLYPLLSGEGIDPLMFDALLSSIYPDKNGAFFSRTVNEFILTSCLLPVALSSVKQLLDKELLMWENNVLVITKKTEDIIIKAVTNKKLKEENNKC